MHQAVELLLQHGEDFAPHAEMTGDKKFNGRMALASAIDRCGEFHLDVTGRIEDERDEHDAIRALRGAIQSFVEQNLGMLDKADFDTPVRVHCPPLLGKLLDLVITLAIA